MLWGLVHWNESSVEITAQSLQVSNTDARIYIHALQKKIYAKPCFFLWSMLAWQVLKNTAAKYMLSQRKVSYGMVNRLICVTSLRCVQLFLPLAVEFQGVVQSFLSADGLFSINE